ncbi:LutC/YkgG family protein [Streptomyces mirabilis]|uniref:LutC/YkgG family protein n=1 Tax=Streptomyces mirabilis TaxID=68239 RepID=UPI0032433C22
MSSRDLILGRVGRALADVPRDDTPYEQAIERGYLREHGSRSVEQTVDLLAENLADYRARVHRCAADELAPTIAGLLAGHGSTSVALPAGLDARWLAASEVTRVPDRAEDTSGELDRVDSVVTACALAIAETGTLVLDGGPDQGRRRITLVPDHHICVVRVPDQVVSSVPQALERLDPTRPLTWISGPSATSDIELDRVEGVHGPRTLEVVLVSGE